MSNGLTWANPGSIHTTCATIGANQGTRVLPGHRTNRCHIRQIVVEAGMPAGATHE
jgi:hypothetical protein